MLADNVLNDAGSSPQTEEGELIENVLVNTQHQTRQTATVGEAVQFFQESRQTPQRTLKKREMQQAYLKKTVFEV